MSSTDTAPTVEPEVDLDKLIDRLMNPSDKSETIQMSEKEVRHVIFGARDEFLKESSLLEIRVPLNVCGDIHGQYRDLLRIFEKCGKPPETAYLFLGDYVDRGANSLETIVLLLALKLRYPDRIYMLRGNHESSTVNRVYGFYAEVKRRFDVKLWRAFGECFNCLPISAIIQERIFCTHGGLSPCMESLDDIKDIERPTEVPDDGLMCDLLWADPLKNSGPNWVPNDRGVSYVFSEILVRKFLQKHHLDLICRAHQVVEQGYEFFAKRQLVTIFSAPNYCNEFDNAGGVMRVDKDLVCSFEIIQPKDK